MFDNDLVELGELLADLAVAVVEEGERTLFTTLRKRGGGRRGVTHELWAMWRLHRPTPPTLRALWGVRSWTGSLTVVLFTSVLSILLRAMWYG